MGGRIWQVLAALILTIVWSAPGAAVTLDLVKQRGELNCGVAGGVRGFSDADETGRWQGLNVDICRALAAAVIGSSEKVAYVPLTEKAPLTALMSGRVDLIVMDTPWTLTLDSSLGIRVVGTSYYDGQSFMVQTRLGRKSALELEGASVCVPGGEGLEDHFNEYVKEHDIRVKSIRHETFSQAARVFANGGCDVLTGNRTRLYGFRQSLERPGAYLVLPEVISREPLGPIVRRGDDGWFAIVRWVLHALIIAEEYGITSASVDEALKKNDDPRISALLGQTAPIGRGFGLDDRWAYRIIKQVGNYGEVFERNVGHLSSLKMDRGLNALWNRGGLHYAPPIP